MIIIEKKKYLWRMKEIWFSKTFFSDNSSDILLFRQCQENRNVENNNIRKKEFTTLVIELDESVDKMWANFNSQCRRHINKGGKLGLKSQVNTKYDEFYSLLNTFIRAKGYTRPVKKKRFNEISKYGDLFTVEFEGETICGHFCLVDDDSRARYLWGASKRLTEGYSRIVGAANRWLHWQAIQHYKQNGIKLYDLGGTNLDTDSSEYGITEFKLGFGGEIVKEYHYVVINKFLLKIAKPFIFKYL